MPDDDDRLAYSPAQAARRLGVSRSKLYRMLDCGGGTLRSFRDGGRRLISHQAITDYISRQESARR